MLIQLGFFKYAGDDHWNEYQWQIETGESADTIADMIEKLMVKGEDCWAPLLMIEDTDWQLDPCDIEESVKKIHAWIMSAFDVTMYIEDLKMGKEV